jgi:hypothetical protein
MDSIAYLPSSSSPTQTLDFGNHRMVMAVQTQQSHGVSGLLENCFFDGWKPRNGFGT